MNPSSTLCVPETGNIPRHIAIIMDGNGRWATRRFMPRTAGHAKGVQAVRRVVEYCGANGIDYLTLFAFSSENWRRPQEEVSLLMKLFVQALEKEVSRLNSNNVRLRVVGDLSPFEPYLQKLIRDAETTTNGNTGLTLTIAANYGGRWDILQAFRKMLQAHPELAQDAAQVSEQMLSEYLCMNWAPEPDLFIRTGGESRISNFLVWQLAYTELYFTDCYWPDFGAKDMDRAIEWYRGRERRFGRTSAQISDNSPSA
ncbi:isoprenyl transferase [Advenella kashmirensis]|nr:isoprenyl transferase [Advenella kashmirensis]